MKLRPFLIVLLSCFLVLSTAYAADPTVPVDPAFLAPYLPDYSLIYSVDEDDTLYLLMQNPSGATVFVGGVQSADGTWAFTESTPLPEGTFLGVENFSTSLGMPLDGKNLCVTLEPHSDGTWGVSLLEWGEIRLGSMWVSDAQPLRGVIGDHPWGDITTIDWTTLPKTCEEAIAHVNSSRWAVVKYEGAQLLRRADSASGNIGKYSCGVPVCMKEFNGDYARVQIGNVEGWMRIEHLAMNVEIRSVPALDNGYVSDGTLLYAEPDESAAAHAIDTSGYVYILGTRSGDWAHIWLTETDEYGYIKQGEVFYGDG